MSAAPSPPVDLSNVGPLLAQYTAVLFSTLSVAYNTLLYVLSLSVAPALYFLSPFLVLAQILLDTLVFTPYAILVYATDALYPLYVFCGTAVICATFMSVGGWVMILALRWLIVRPPRTEQSARVGGGTPRKGKASARQKKRVRILE